MVKCWLKFKNRLSTLLGGILDNSKMQVFWLEFSFYVGLICPI